VLAVHRPVEGPGWPAASGAIGADDELALQKDRDARETVRDDLKIAPE